MMVTPLQDYKIWIKVEQLTHFCFLEGEKRRPEMRLLFAGYKRLTLRENVRHDSRVLTIWQKISEIADGM